MAAAGSGGGTPLFTLDSEELARDYEEGSASQQFQSGKRLVAGLNGAEALAGGAAGGGWVAGAGAVKSRSSMGECYSRCGRLTRPDMLRP